MEGILHRLNRLRIDVMAISIFTAGALVTSTLTRICAVLYWRFFPAHFHLLTITLFAAHVPLFIQAYFTKPQLTPVKDEVNVLIKSTAGASSEGDVTGEDDNDQGDQEIEEVEVEETITLAEDIPSIPTILLFGIPSSRRPFASLFTFIINLIFIGLTADSVLRSRYYPAQDLSFVRLGYVSDSEARFLIREPDQSKMPVSIELRIKDTPSSLSSASSSATAHLAWKSAGGVQWTSNETDFTGLITVPISHVQQRTWEWRTSNNHTGEFTSAPKAGAMPEDGKFTFLSTSCILPRFPYSPLDHPLGIPGLRYLAEKIPELQAQFMLFLGDFIYVDVPQRFSNSTEEYRMQYRQVYASPEWPSVSQNLSWIHVWDDHEISNDWSSQKTGLYHSAVDPWNIYHTSVNPPRAPQANARNIRRTNATWYEFTQGPATFFMLDTRSYRSSNYLPFEQTDKTMLGAEQLEDLIAWLGRPEPRGVHWKVIASSIPFTKNWPINTKETWGGFLVERRKVLESMWDAGARGYGVVVLSGDRHEFAATKFPPPPESTWPETATAFEFSTSPLNQFASPIGTYRQTDNEDVMVKYIPKGNTKFGSFTFETIDGQPTLRYRLFINGEERWDTLVTGPSIAKSDNPIASFWDRLGLP